jgi:alcohol dehydrogenase class IV
MRFEFTTAGRIIFGQGTINEVAPLAAQFGTTAFVLTGRTARHAEPLVEQLTKQAVKSITFTVPPEPTTTVANQAVEKARDAKCALVIGIGGGSVLDTGKVVAAMLTNSGELADYLEVVGQGKPLKEPPVPYIAIPTTAGTGAEVTRNSVLAVPEHHVKVSMRGPFMLPRVAVVDPELTCSVPPALTGSTGLDALTQLMEVFVCNNPNPMTDALCREGIKRAATGLLDAYRDAGNRAARRDMAVASLFSGLGLANARLGAVHGFAGPLGGMISAPHGVICARLLPCVMAANLQALQTRKADAPVLRRFDELARLLTGKPQARAADGLAWVQKLCAELNVPPLTQFGLKSADYPTVVAKAKRASSMKGNPIQLTDDELIKILTDSENPLPA